MDLLAHSVAVAAVVLAHFAGKYSERRKNGAMAVCVQCEHTSPKTALAIAVRKAKLHKAETGHQCMVVKG